MELPHIGQHCSLEQCNRLDFLPITCDACKRVYCVDHYKYETHQCDKARDKDVQVPVCPICMQPVGLKRDQLPDIAVSEHIDKYCKRNHLIENKTSSNKTNLQKCSFKSCKQKDIIYLECQDCRTKFCVKHRHPTDHSCPGPSRRSFSSNVADNWSSFRGSCSSSASSGIGAIKTKAMQISKSGQAALSRMTSRNNHMSNGEQPSSSLGDRQAITTLQGNLSEQEALAIALGESMSSTKEKLPPQNTTDKEIERHDAELARALYESELEAQRRNQHPQKSNCSLS